MRFKEFKSKQQVDELMPAIGTALRSVGGAAIQATRNATTMGAKKLQGVKPLGSAEKDTASGGVEIPAVGSEIVLPDKDTKQPSSYTIRSMRGNDIELEPVTKARQTNDPKLNIKVNRRDLENTLKAVSPQSQDKRTL